MLKGAGDTQISERSITRAYREFVTALGLSAVRWGDDYHLAILGTLSFGAVYVGRQAVGKRWRNWPSFHLSAMGASYILLLTALYVDNGKNLPLCESAANSYWLLPAIIGAPIILYVLRTILWCVRTTVRSYRITNIRGPEPNTQLNGTLTT